MTKGMKNIDDLDKITTHIKFNIDKNEIFEQDQNDSINYPTADFMPNPNFKASSAQFGLDRGRKEVGK